MTKFPKCTSNEIRALQLLRSNVIVASVQNKCVPSIRIRVTIQYDGKPIDAIVLIDSGAEGNYLHSKFVDHYKIQTHKLSPPVYVRNIDGTINKQGIMSDAATLRMEIGAHWEDIEFAVTNIGNHAMLLGTDWLAAHNPSIDWTTKTISFTRCPKECKDLPTHQSPAIRQILPIDTWEPQYDDEFDKHSDGTDVTQCMVAHRHKYEGPKNAYFIPGDSPSMG